MRSGCVRGPVAKMAGLSRMSLRVWIISCSMWTRGWDSSLDLEFGSRKLDASVSFTEPWLLDTPTLLGIDIYSTRWKWEGYYTERKQGGGIRLGRRLRWPDDYFFFSTAYHLSAYHYSDFSTSYNPSPVYDLRTYEWPRWRSMVGITLSRDSRDSRLFATSGSFNSLSLSIAGDLLGGNEEFQKVIASSYWYYKFLPFMSLVAKAKYGVLTSLWGTDKDIPFGERFFPGGISPDGQLRGYIDRSVGPVDSAGFHPGGRAVFVSSLELRFPIMPQQLYMSLFFDAGDAWRNPEQTTYRKLYKSVGVGARFVIPMVGMLGFDLGYGFERKGYELHFQIGPEQ